MTNVVSAPVILAVSIMPALSPSPPQLYAATGPEATNAATEPATASRPLHVLYISGRLLSRVRRVWMGAAVRRPLTDRQEPTLPAMVRCTPKALPLQASGASDRMLTVPCMARPPAAGTGTPSGEAGGGKKPLLLARRASSGLTVKPPESVMLVISPGNSLLLRTTPCTLRMAVG